MFSSVMSRAFIAFCLITTTLFISTPAFCQDISNYVNCTNRKNDDKLLFLKKNAASTTMYQCKEGVLKQKGCYIDRAVSDKKCVTLTAFKATNYDLTNQAYRLYDDTTDQIRCDNYANNGMVQTYVHPRIAEKCPGDGRTKYNEFGGHPLCNTKDVQVYQFGERAWKKCDENGQFIVQNCITNTPKRCITKTYWDERVTYSPDRDNIRNDEKPFCEKMEQYFDEVEHSDDFTGCDFDAPVYFYMTEPVLLPETATLTPSTSVAIPAKPETTTTEIQTTTEEDEVAPGDKCLHGALNDVWYENDVPLKCQVLWYDEKTCIHYEKLRYNLTFYRNVHIPDLKIWQDHWDEQKESMLKKYDDINKDYKDNENYDLHDSIKTLKEGDRWDFRSAVTNIENAFAPEHSLWLNDEFINKPYVFCQLVHNFLPIKQDFLLEHSENCPSSSYVKDNCIKTDPRRVPKDYPKIMHNVYYNKEKKPAKCYVKEAYPSCINFGSAERLLDNLKTIIIGPGYSNKKDELLKARIMLDVKRRYTDSSQISSLKQRMNGGDDIWEIIEYNFKQLVNFEGEVEREFVVDGRRIKMGPATFCAVIGELIPVKFDNENLTEYLEDC